MALPSRNYSLGDLPDDDDNEYLEGDQLELIKNDERDSGRRG